MSKDEYRVARNMQMIQTNILQKKLCVKLVTYQNYTKMHGPKNNKKGIMKANASRTGKWQGLVNKSVSQNAVNTTQIKKPQSRTVLYPIKTEASTTALQSGN